MRSIQIHFIFNTAESTQITAEIKVLTHIVHMGNEQLHKLAMVVFGVPPTEVQIERDFSLLNFVFSNRRCMLQQERLEDIMVIHLNPDLFYEVKEEQLIAFKSRKAFRSLVF